MSHEILKQIDTLKLPKMSVCERLVFGHLCFFAHDKLCFAWVGPKLLQKRTGIAHRTLLNRTLRNLVKIGVISRAFGPNDHGRNVDGFTINMGEFEELPVLPSKNSEYYGLDSTVLPPENSEYQHKKTVRKQLKTEEVAGGEKTKFLEKFVKTKLEENLEGDFSNMFQKKKEMPNPYMNLTAEKIAKFQVKTEPPVKKIHAGTLCTIWKMCHAEFYPDIFIGQPTLAERGMFKQYIKFATHEHAIAALYFAVKYWIGFVKFCQKNGAVGKPSTPKIKYLLKYVKQSVTFYTSKQNSITGVYKPLPNYPGKVDLMEPDGKVIYQEVGKESGSELISDVPMNLEDAGKLYKKLFQKGQA